MRKVIRSLCFCSGTPLTLLSAPRPETLQPRDREAECVHLGSRGLCAPESTPRGPGGFSFVLRAGLWGGGLACHLSLWALGLLAAELQVGEACGLQYRPGGGHFVEGSHCVPALAWELPGPPSQGQAAPLDPHLPRSLTLRLGPWVLSGAQQASARGQRSLDVFRGGPAVFPPNRQEEEGDVQGREGPWGAVWEEAGDLLPPLTCPVAHTPLPVLTSPVMAESTQLLTPTITPSAPRRPTASEPW